MHRRSGEERAEALRKAAEEQAAKIAARADRRAIAALAAEATAAEELARKARVTAEREAEEASNKNNYDTVKAGTETLLIRYKQAGLRVGSESFIVTTAASNIVGGPNLTAVNREFFNTPNTEAFADLPPFKAITITRRPPNANLNLVIVRLSEVPLNMVCFSVDRELKLVDDSYSNIHCNNSVTRTRQNISLTDEFHSLAAPRKEAINQLSPTIQRLITPRVAVPVAEDTSPVVSAAVEDEVASTPHPLGRVRSATDLSSSAPSLASLPSSQPADVLDLEDLEDVAAATGPGYRGSPHTPPTPSRSPSASSRAVSPVPPMRPMSSVTSRPASESDSGRSSGSNSPREANELVMAAALGRDANQENYARYTRFLTNVEALLNDAETLLRYNPRLQTDENKNIFDTTRAAIESLQASKPGAHVYIENIRGFAPMVRELRRQAQADIEAGGAELLDLLDLLDSVVEVNNNRRLEETSTTSASMDASIHTPSSAPAPSAPSAVAPLTLRMGALAGAGRSARPSTSVAVSAAVASPAPAPIPALDEDDIASTPVVEGAGSSAAVSGIEDDIASIFAAASEDSPRVSAPIAIVSTEVSIAPIAPVATSDAPVVSAPALAVAPPASVPASMEFFDAGADIDPFYAVAADLLSAVAPSLGADSASAAVYEDVPSAPPASVPVLEADDQPNPVDASLSLDAVDVPIASAPLDIIPAAESIAAPPASTPLHSVGEVGEDAVAAMFEVADSPRVPTPTAIASTEVLVATASAVVSTAPTSIPVTGGGARARRFLARAPFVGRLFRARSEVVLSPTSASVPSVSEVTIDVASLVASPAASVNPASAVAPAIPVDAPSAIDASDVPSLAPLVLVPAVVVDDSLPAAESIAAPPASTPSVDLVADMFGSVSLDDFRAPVSTAISSIAASVPTTGFLDSLRRRMTRATAPSASPFSAPVLASDVSTIAPASTSSRFGRFGFSRRRGNTVIPEASASVLASDATIAPLASSAISAPTGDSIPARDGSLVVPPPVLPRFGRRESAASAPDSSIVHSLIASAIDSVPAPSIVADEPNPSVAPPSVTSDTPSVIISPNDSGVPASAAISVAPTWPRRFFGRRSLPIAPVPSLDVVSASVSAIDGAPASTIPPVEPSAAPLTGWRREFARRWDRLLRRHIEDSGVFPPLPVPASTLPTASDGIELVDIDTPPSAPPFVISEAPSDTASAPTVPAVVSIAESFAPSAPALTPSTRLFNNTRNALARIRFGRALGAVDATPVTLEMAQMGPAAATAVSNHSVSVPPRSSAALSLPPVSNAAGLREGVLKIFPIFRRTASTSPEIEMTSLGSSAAPAASNPSVSVLPTLSAAPSSPPVPPSVRRIRSGRGGAAPSLPIALPSAVGVPRVTPSTPPSTSLASAVPSIASPSPPSTHLLPTRGVTHLSDGLVVRTRAISGEVLRNNIPQNLQHKLDNLIKERPESEAEEEETKELKFIDNKYIIKIGRPGDVLKNDDVLSLAQHTPSNGYKVGLKNIDINLEEGVNKSLFRIKKTSSGYQMVIDDEILKEYSKNKSESKEFKASLLFHNVIANNQAFANAERSAMSR